MAFEIHSGIGVNEIRFGMTQEEVHALLGEPKKVFGLNTDSKNVSEDYEGLSIDFVKGGGCFQIVIGNSEPVFLQGISLQGDDYEVVCSELMALDENLVMNELGCVSFKYCILLFFPGILRACNRYSGICVLSPEHIMKGHGYLLEEKSLHRPNPLTKLKGDMVYVTPGKDVGGVAFGEKGFPEAVLGKPLDEGVALDEWVLRKGQRGYTLLDSDERFCAALFAPCVPVVVTGKLLTGQLYSQVAKAICDEDEDKYDMYYYEVSSPDMYDDGAWSSRLNLYLLSQGACYPSASVDGVIVNAEDDSGGRALYRHISSLWQEDPSYQLFAGCTG